MLLILVLGALATPALAHRVLIYAYAEGDTIFTESKFVPDTPVRQGKIQVMDKQTGKVLLTGQTDDQGKFAFKIPPEAAAQRLDLNIVVDAAMGHRAEWLLKATSYLTGAAPGSPAAPAKPGQASTPAASAPASQDTHVQMGQQELEAALNKVLERQLGPINEKLTELTIHRTTLTDILGGIGYILGLCGLGAYFLSKRKNNP
jgi:nickel transport protein